MTTCFSYHVTMSNLLLNQTNRTGGYGMALQGQGKGKGKYKLVCMRVLALPARLDSSSKTQPNT